MTPKLRFKKEDGSAYPEWEEKTLGEVTEEFLYGMNASAKPYDGKHGYIRITDIDEDSRRYLKEGRVSFEASPDDKFKLIPSDILFARTGASTGKSYIYKEEDGLLYHAGFLIRARLDHMKVNPMFIYQQTLTKRYREWVRIMSIRSGQPGINATEYGLFHVQIASIDEQQKIANFLTALDARITDQRELLELLEKRKQGMLQRVFSQQVRFVDADGQSFPAWEEKRLDEVCQIVGGGTPSTDVPEYWGGDISWFTPTEVGINKYVSKSKRTITSMGMQKSSAKLLPIGTVLLSTRATLAEMSILQEPATTNQGFQSLIPNEGTVGEFIYYLGPFFKKHFYAHASGSTFLEISKTEISKTMVRVPAEREQQKIADFFTALDVEIDVASSLLNDYVRQKNAMLQQLFA